MLNNILHNGYQSFSNSVVVQFVKGDINALSCVLAYFRLDGERDVNSQSMELQHPCYGTPDDRGVG
jgi:hypothetical protein